MWIATIVNLILSLVNFLIWYYNKEKNKLVSLNLWVSGVLFGACLVILIHHSILR